MNLTINKLQNVGNEILKLVSDICNENKIQYFTAYGTNIGVIRHGGPIPWDSDTDIVIPYNQLNKFILILRENLPDRFFVDYYDINPYYTDLFPRVGLRGYSTETLHLDVFLACGLPDSRKDQIDFLNSMYRLRLINYYKTANSSYQYKITTRHWFRILLNKILYLPLSKRKIRNKFHLMCNENPYENSNYIINTSCGYGLKEIIPRKWLGVGKSLNYVDFKITAPEEINSYLEHFYGDYMTYPPESERQIKEFYKIHRLSLG